MKHWISYSERIESDKGSYYKAACGAEVGWENGVRRSVDVTCAECRLYRYDEYSKRFYKLEDPEAYWVKKILETGKCLCDLRSTLASNFCFSSGNLQFVQHGYYDYYLSYSSFSYSHIIAGNGELDFETEILFLGERIGLDELYKSIENAFSSLSEECERQISHEKYEMRCLEEKIDFKRKKIEKLARVIDKISPNPLGIKKLAENIFTWPVSFALDLETGKIVSIQTKKDAYGDNKNIFDAIGRAREKLKKD